MSSKKGIATLEMRKGRHLEDAAPRLSVAGKPTRQVLAPGGNDRNASGVLTGVLPEGGAPESTIFIRHNGDGFRVSVEPAPGGQDWSRDVADHKAARGWASGLRLTHRWPIVDEVEAQNA